MAFRSYVGGRFEMFRRGFVGNGYMYDINSAYPSAIAQIPDLSKGKWIKRKSIHPDSKLGFFKILADIPDDKYVPPFPFRANHNIVFPSGKFITYVTLNEIQACKNPDFYQILESSQFIPSSESYPYRDFIHNLYLKRLELKQNGSPMQLPIKIILNSIYGKTGQKVNRVIGNLFNPVLFAFITGFARAKLYSFVMQNDVEKQTVAFATDSVCTTKKLDINSSKLGEFSFVDSANDVFYLQNGFYRFNQKWKLRGLGRIGSKKIEHLDTFEKNKRLYYRFTGNRNSRLRSAIIQNKLSDIGKIKPITREVNLNADRKRQWLGILSGISNDQYNYSMPLSLNHFKKEEI